MDNDHMKTARDKITLPLYRLAAVAPITYKSNIPTNVQNMYIIYSLFVFKYNHHLFTEIQT